MAGFIDILRTGAWLTAKRVRLVALALLAAFVLGAGFLIATSNGLNDRFGRPLGTDFSNVYAAGSYVLEGQPTAPFDPARQFAREQAIFGQATQFYGWHYPPFFLGLAGLLALMPYWLALIAWLGHTRDRVASPGGHERTPLAPARAGIPCRLYKSRAGPQWFPDRGADRRRALPTRPPADPRRHPDRLSDVQAAVRAVDPAGADRNRPLARVRRRCRYAGGHGARGHVRLRGRCVERVPRYRQIHPHRRARAGRHRLVQNSECLLLGPPVGRRHRTRLRAASHGHTYGCHRVDLAVAQPGGLSAQSRRPADRQRAGDALQPRLRPDAAGAGHRLSRARRIRARLRALGKNRAGGAVDRAAGRPLDSAGHADSAGGSNPIAGLHPVVAPRHERMRRAKPVAFCGTPMNGANASLEYARAPDGGGINFLVRSV